MGRGHRRPPQGPLRDHQARLRPHATAALRPHHQLQLASPASGATPGQANYGAAKSAIAGLTRVVARDLGRYGVTCNAIAPRAWTRLVATIPGRDGNPDTERLTQLDPEMIAPMVAYLATDEAWNVNGQTFLVYAGTVAVLQHPTPWRTAFKPGMWTLDELSKAVPELSKARATRRRRRTSSKCPAATSRCRYEEGIIMADTERNKQTVARLFDAFRAGDTNAFDDLIVNEYVQHNPQAGNGLQAVKDFFAPVGPVDVEVHRVIAEGDFVAVHSNYKTWNMAGIDIFRLNDDGKIIEHWDVLQQVPETTASGNDMFSQLS